MEWISVKDRLPEEGVEVFCYEYSGGHGQFYFGRYVKGEWRDNELDPHGAEHHKWPNTTHWMMPEKPKQ